MSEDDPQAIQLQRRLLVDAMLIGVALSQDGDQAKVRDQVTPESMITVTGQLLMQAIKEQDRTRFRKLLSRRFGVNLRHKEPVVDALMRHLNRSNAVIAALDMSEILLHEIRKRSDLADIEDRWAEGLEALKKANATEE